MGSPVAARSAPPASRLPSTPHPAAEPLALVGQRGERAGGDTIINLLAQQRQKLGRQRERTAERLKGAQGQLEHLHWWNRGRRAELQTETALDRQALERTDAKERAATRTRRTTPHGRACPRTRRTIASLQPESRRRSAAI